MLGRSEASTFLAFSETHVNNMTTSEELKINGYNFERIFMDRTFGKGGGVGVYIKEDLVYYRRRDLERQDIECIWLEILLPNSKGILVGNIYRPPESR